METVICEAWQKELTYIRMPFSPIGTFRQGRLVNPNLGGLYSISNQKLVHKIHVFLGCQ